MNRGSTGSTGNAGNTGNIGTGNTGNIGNTGNTENTGNTGGYKDRQAVDMDNMLMKARFDLAATHLLSSQSAVRASEAMDDQEMV